MVLPGLLAVWAARHDYLLYGTTDWSLCPYIPPWFSYICCCCWTENTYFNNEIHFSGNDSSSIKNQRNNKNSNDNTISSDSFEGENGCLRVVLKWLRCLWVHAVIHESKGYFPAVVQAYAVGLCLANIAVEVFEVRTYFSNFDFSGLIFMLNQTGQPALLYIVPCTLGIVIFR